jgi:hypothetical protein
MAESQLMLTDEEKGVLLELLTLTLKERLVEEHRTRTPPYREHTGTPKLSLKPC